MIVMNATRIAGMDSFVSDVKLNDDLKKSITEHCEKYISKYAMPKLV